jgi:hypothetical protein
MFCNRLTDSLKLEQDPLIRPGNGTSDDVSVFLLTTIPPTSKLVTAVMQNKTLVSNTSSRKSGAAKPLPD